MQRRRIWRLLTTLTAFTIAHSITLALSVLGYVDVPPAPIEAIIALSIVFVGAEIIYSLEGRPSLIERQPWLVAFIFGLLHGLGFAGALSEIGLPEGAIPMALFSFNVGVELGQVAFDVAVLVLLWSVWRLRIRWPAWAWRVPAYAIGSLAAFWSFQRVAAILGTAQKLELESLLDPEPSHQRDLVLAMIVARVLHPASKLATTRLWGSTSLAGTLGVEEATEDDLYGALDWLLERQEGIEERLAQRHLEPGGLVLYDLTSTYMEGTHCPLARRGYSRDGRRGTLQVEFGLITNAQGQPVAIDVFPGNTSDATTVPQQVEKVRERFGVEQVVWVGDRGMITQIQIDKLRELAGVSWITALRAPSIRQLVEAGSIQLSLFDTQNLVEVADSRYPGERLVVCYNPMMAQQRAGKREELLAATERELEQVARRVQAGAAGGRGGLVGEARIGERVGRGVNKYKMAKHFTWTISDQAFSYARNQDSITQEAALDGLYVLRTNVSKEQLDAPRVVLAYKSLSQVEQAFRHLKLGELEVRPIYHHLERRVKAHLLLCMLAYYLQRAMEQALAPLLFADESPPQRPDPVGPAPRSNGAKRKEGTKKTTDGLPVHSFRTLLAHLGTMVKNRLILKGVPEAPGFDQVTLPTQLQARAFELLQLPINPL